MHQVQRLEEEVIEIKVREGIEITFGPHNDRVLLRTYNDAFVVTIDMGGVWVAQTIVDTKSFVNIMYYDCWTQLGIERIYNRRWDPYSDSQGKWL